MTTLIGPLRRAVQIAPDRVAVRCGEVGLTYAQVWDRAGRLVGALHGLGVGAGDRVAVVGRNCHRYLELYQAVPGAGMVLVPLNQRLTPVELGHALEDSGARSAPTRAGWSRHRCSMRRGRSRCWRSYGTRAVTSCCRRSIRARRSI
jgi:acyl-CoA synthetase (AMP-forming)/AMP-acid ligase II